MKYVFVLMSLFLSISMFSPVIAQEEEDTPPPSGGAFAICEEDDISGSEVCRDANQGETESNPVILILKNVTQLIAFLIGGISVIMIIVAGFRLITSSGNPDAVQQARNTIIYALIGVAVALLAQAVVIFVLNRLTINMFQN